MAGFDMNNRVVVLGLRVTQAIFAIIILGLSAYVAHWWHHWYRISAPSEVSFIIFCAVWTFLALVYLILVPWRFSETVAHHKFAILGVEALTMIFWFAGFIALAVFVGDRVCYGSVCNAAKAADVFAAFTWLLFAITTAMAVMHVVRSSNRTTRSNKADPNINIQEGV